MAGEKMKTPKAKEKSYIQVPLADWPKGLERELAVLRASPTELDRRLKLKFVDSQDNFDFFTGALVNIENKKCFALVRHRNDPMPGTMIWTSWQSKDLSADLREIMQALELKDDDLTWSAPEALRKEPEKLVETAVH